MRVFRPNSKLIATGLGEMKTAATGEVEDGLYNHTARVFYFLLGGNEIITIKDG